MALSGVPRPCVRRSARGARLPVSARAVAVRGVEPETAALRKQFASLLSKFDFNFRAGDKVTGTVLSVDSGGITVDVGAKNAAFCPAAECSLAKLSDLATPGARMEFVIIKDDTMTRNQSVQLSLRRMQLERAWQLILEGQKLNTTYECKVMGMNKGGLLVEVAPSPAGSIAGFLPQGQLQRTGGSSGPPVAEDVIGTTLAVRVMEATPETGRLVLSNRRAVEAESRKAHAIGDVLVGSVQSIQPYGAFVDLEGGGSGLLHISEVSSSSVQTLDGVLAIGNRVKVMVINSQGDKLSLSTRKLESTPGEMLKNPQNVFDRAEQTAAEWKARMALLVEQAGEGGLEGAAPGGRSGGGARSGAGAPPQRPAPYPPRAPGAPSRVTVRKTGDGAAPAGPPARLVPAGGPPPRPRPAAPPAAGAAKPAAAAAKPAAAAAKPAGAKPAAPKK